MSLHDVLDPASDGRRAATMRHRHGVVEHRTKTGRPENESDSSS
ncbi:MAG: hypothetical protein ACLS37_10815 [Alistipes sp.]